MKKCSVEGCERRVKAKGYCPMHYQRHRTGLPLDLQAGTPWSDEEDLLLVECPTLGWAEKYVPGGSPRAQLAEKLGRSYQALYARLRRLNGGPLGRYRIKKGRWTEREDEIIRLTRRLRKNPNWQRVADFLCRAHGAVRQRSWYLRKNENHRYARRNRPRLNERPLPKG